MVVACLREYQTDLGKPLSRGQGAARFERGITEMAIELSRCITQGEAGARAALHDVMTVDHELSVSLLSGTAGDPKSLGWLSHTPARAGCLGLWSTDPAAGGDGGRRLDIAGWYRRDGDELRLPAQSRMEQFPPNGLLDDLEWRPGELAIVFPTKTPSVDLGLLAVVTHLHPAEESGRDRLFEDNALLSVSLEREVMTERLRRSNADLATFSHAMAHDLRNPLATISMWAAVARMRAGPGDDAAPVLQVVDQIKDVADYANELVTDLLQYADLDRGDQHGGARRPQPGRRPGDHDHRLDHRAAGRADRDRQPAHRLRPARRAAGGAPEPHRERHQVPRRSAAPDPAGRRARRAGPGR